LNLDMTRSSLKPPNSVPARSLMGYCLPLLPTSTHRLPGAFSCQHGEAFIPTRSDSRPARGPDHVFPGGVSWPSLNGSAVIRCEATPSKASPPAGSRVRPIGLPRRAWAKKAYRPAKAEAIVVGCPPTATAWYRDYLVPLLTLPERFHQITTGEGSITVAGATITRWTRCGMTVTRSGSTPRRRLPRSAASPAVISHTGSSCVKSFNTTGGHRRCSTSSTSQRSTPWWTISTRAL
jgi:hypothetical protein